MDQLGQYLLAGLAGGALAFAHCLGMCGGFVLHLAGSSSQRTSLGRQMLWHAGRTSTYVFLGGLAGFGGLLLGRQMAAFQNILAYVAGGVMIVLGLTMLGLVPRIRWQVGGGAFAGLFGPILAAPAGPAAFALGLATGFLPCPIVLAYLALSAQSGSVLTGMATMAAVGAGSVWALLLLGLTGGMLTARLKKWGVVAGGIVLVLLGMATAMRATDTFHRLLGCQQCDSAQSAPTTPATQSEPAACPHCSPGPATNQGS